MLTKVIAHLLVTEGFSSDEVSMVSSDELASIEGFDDDLSSELINRAKSHIEKSKERKFGDSQKFRNGRLSCQS